MYCPETLVWHSGGSRSSEWTNEQLSKVAWRQLSLLQMGHLCALHYGATLMWWPMPTPLPLPISQHQHSTKSARLTDEVSGSAKGQSPRWRMALLWQTFGSPISGEEETLSLGQVFCFLHRPTSSWTGANLISNGNWIPAVGARHPHNSLCQPFCVYIAFRLWGLQIWLREKKKNKKNILCCFYFGFRLTIDMIWKL